MTIKKTDPVGIFKSHRILPGSLIKFQHGQN